ncbi:MAG: DNA repair protein RecO, partial [Acidobacteriota bacterium]
LVESFFEVHQDFRASCAVSYFAELVEEFFPSRAKEDLVFRLLHSTLQSIKEGGNLDLLSRYFEAWFLQVSGLLPDFRRCRKCRKKLARGGWLSPKMDGVYCESCAPWKKNPVPADFAKFLAWARKNPPPGKGTMPFAPDRLEASGKILQSLIIFHLEREPKTLHFLKN